MYTYFDHAFRNPLTAGTLPCAVTHDLGQYQGLAQVMRKPAKQFSRIDRISWLGTFVRRRFGARVIRRQRRFPGRSSELIDGSIADDGEKPGPERSPRFVGMPGLMQGQQTLLDTVIEAVQLAESADQVGTNNARKLGQELPVSLPVTRLGTRQPV